jgi:hypothetical protein
VDRFPVDLGGDDRRSERLAQRVPRAGEAHPARRLVDAHHVQAVRAREIAHAEDVLRARAVKARELGQGKERTGTPVARHVGERGSATQVDVDDAALVGTRRPRCRRSSLGGAIQQDPDNLIGHVCTLLSRMAKKLKL